MIDRLLPLSICGDFNQMADLHLIFLNSIGLLKALTNTL